MMTRIGNTMGKWWIFRRLDPAAEIARVLHTYRLDLERLTLLRDKALSDGEFLRYDSILTIAEKTLERLLQMHEENEQEKLDALAKKKTRRQATRG